MAREIDTKLQFACSHGRISPIEVAPLALRGVAGRSATGATLLVGLLCSFLPSAFASASTIADDFSTDPLTNGWAMFGDTNLFHWNATNQNLEVTWDSSQANSYFFHPLGTILTPQDDFRLSFDITLLDEVNSNAFEICIGLLNTVNATSTNFFRGTGNSSPNLIEFAYFPAFSFFQPTFSQVVVSTNSVFLYNHDNLLEMTPGQVFHIAMSYSSATRQLTTVTTNNGQMYGVAQVISVPANFEFRLGSFSISSYSSHKADGSILAHGLIDNVIVSAPDPPVQQMTGRFGTNGWQVQFLSQSNWVYTLERTADFKAWTAITSTASSGGMLSLVDPNPPEVRALYRLNAARP